MSDLLSELTCARCKAFRFPGHVCAPRWAVVILDEHVPPVGAFAWEDADNYEDVYADDAEEAARLARARNDQETSDYESTHIAGVMPIAEFYGLEFADGEDFRLIDPAALSWFLVECSFEPTYNAVRVR